MSVQSLHRRSAVDGYRNGDQESLDELGPEAGKRDGDHHEGNP
jgi:hypothetical protein